MFGISVKLWQLSAERDREEINLASLTRFLSLIICMSLLPTFFCR